MAHGSVMEGCNDECEIFLDAVGEYGRPCLDAENAELRAAVRVAERQVDGLTDSLIRFVEQRSKIVVEVA